MLSWFHGKQRRRIENGYSHPSPRLVNDDFPAVEYCIIGIALSSQEGWACSNLNALHAAISSREMTFD